LLLIPFIAVAQSPDSSQAGETNASGATAKKPAPRSHRVLTNDDIPSRTPGNSTPEIEARLQQLNLCDRACFAQVFKDSQMAFRQRYNYPSPFSDKNDHAFQTPSWAAWPRFAAIRVANLVAKRADREGCLLPQVRRGTAKLGKGPR